MKMGRAFSAHALIAVLGALAMGPDAFALTTLKQVQVSDGSRIDLYFDSKVDLSKIKAEFFNDIIQLSMEDVSVYPAKISSVNGKELAKIFAYQYAPKLVRCRFTVRGKAESYERRLQLKPNGRVLTVFLGGAGGSGAEADQISTQSAAPKVAQAATATATIQKAPETDSGSKPDLDKEDRILLEKVLKADAAASEAAAKETASKELAAKEAASKEAQAKESAKESPKKSEEQASAKLGGGKSLPGMPRLLAAVSGVFGLLLLALYLVKRGRGQQRGLSGAIARFARKSLGKDAKMIEMVATHYLGPNKSIAMIRVAGKLLVLGIANDSISLITTLESDEAIDPDSLAFAEPGLAAEPKIATPKFAIPPPQQPKGAPKGGMKDFYESSGQDHAAMFADLLGSENRLPSRGAGAGATAAGSPTFARPAPATGTRAQIRNRLEGLKPL